jgi:adenine-specific DNA-methyltransferase
MLAKNLLSDDGVIFVSIDDNEQTNIKKMLDLLFGERCFIAQIIIEGTPKNDPLIVSTAHEYCLVYVKNYEVAKEQNWGISNDLYLELDSIFKSSSDHSYIEKKLKEFYVEKDLLDNNLSNYKFVDKNGIYRIGPIDDPQSSGSKDVRFNPYTGQKLLTPKRGWSCSLETWNEWIKKDLVYFPEDNSKLCSKKTYIDSKRLDLLRSHIKIQTRKDTEFLEKLFGSKVFSYPKPVKLIKDLVQSNVNKEMIILDFFSGSATTAHAVMQLNAEDGGNRKFIMVQLPENLDNNLKSTNSNREKQVIKNAIEFCEQFNLPHNICEIGKERIRRAGELVKKDLIEKNAKLGKDEEIVDHSKLDIGFKVFKLDESNFKEWDSSKEPTVEQLELFADPIKEGKSEEEVLYEVLLKYGVFDQEVKKLKINNKDIYSISDNYLLIMLSNKIEDKDIEEIKKLKPKVVIFRDSGFNGNDTVKINAFYNLTKSGVEEVKTV